MQPYAVQAKGFRGVECLQTLSHGHGRYFHTRHITRARKPVWLVAARTIRGQASINLIVGELIAGLEDEYRVQLR